MNQTNPPVAVVIVGYNSQKYLADCLASLFLSSYKNFRVIFVDNHSDDQSVAYINKHFPDVVVVKSSQNLGFAAGSNLGIDKSRQLGSELVFLLNPDTVIVSRCLEILVEKSDEQTIVQPLILIHEHGQKTNLINTTGNYLNFLGFSYCSDLRKPAGAVKESEIASASGAAVLVPAKALQEVGGFDENFFMYHEDVDLFWRMRLAGYNIKLIPEATVWHKYLFSANKSKFFLAERNRLLFLYKNFSGRYWLLTLPILLVNEALMLLYALLTGWLQLKVKSTFSFFQLLGVESKRRKAINLNRRIKDRDLKKFIGSEISFSEVPSPFFAPYNVVLQLYWGLIYRLI